MQESNTLLDLAVFAQYVDKYGSPFSAVQQIAKEARFRAESNDNIIMHSEAISWVISGNKPDILNRYTTRRARRVNAYISIIDDVLSEVDDEDVCNAVRESIKTSKNVNHLIYMYKSVHGEDRQARVRILTRIVWYKLHNS